MRAEWCRIHLSEADTRSTWCLPHSTLRLSIASKRPLCQYRFLDDGDQAGKGEEQKNAQTVSGIFACCPTIGAKGNAIEVSSEKPNPHPLLNAPDSRMSFVEALARVTSLSACPNQRGSDKRYKITGTSCQAIGKPRFGTPTAVGLLSFWQRRPASTIRTIIMCRDSWVCGADP